MELAIPFLAECVLNGVVYGSMLALLTIGLTLIYGLMGVVNFAHGGFYMLGAFVAFQIIQFGGNYWIGLLLAPLIVALVAFAVEPFSRRTYGKGSSELVLSLTFFFGLSLLLEDVCRIIWGSLGSQFSTPKLLSGVVNLGIFQYSQYRLFFVLFCAAAMVGVWAFLRKTSFGIIIRAGIQNRDMVEALGINITVVYLMTFVIGVALAAVAGVAYAPLVGVYPDMGMQVMIFAFVVVAVGGMGSFRGSIISSLLIGQVYHFAVLISPEFSHAAVFGFLALVLCVTKTGLFGEAGR